MSATAFPVVGIGASAGGLDAFHKFLDCMPPDCGMAFVMILHLPPDRKSMLPDILARWTAMPVVEGVDGTVIRQNYVYVPPPHSVVSLTDGRLDVRALPIDSHRVQRPIDAFFDALGSSLGDRAVGIVLSGTGSDGALGLKAIKECGGLTIAQGSDGSAPQYGEMPAGAIATGSVDLVVPIEEIPGQLLRIKGISPAGNPAEGIHSDVGVNGARLKICAILQERVGHDFSGYRDKTFLRRVQRRMHVVGAATLDEYAARLQSDQNEGVLLFRDLLIRVTSFFRDKDTFDVLKREVIPHLFTGKHANGSVRVWVPGCATGEEAYSLAILLREHMDQLFAVPKVQIFATDIDDTAVSTARLGRYPPTLVQGLSAERLERFFMGVPGGFVVSKEIRDLCTFSPHNLVQDPPFSRMDMVSCRNLLIYMGLDLQATVIPVFHYSLLPGGILLLGGAESAAKHQDLFEPLDKAARIFKRRNTRTPGLPIDWHRSDPAPSHVALEASRLTLVERSEPLDARGPDLILRHPDVRPNGATMHGSTHDGPPAPLPTGADERTSLSTTTATDELEQAKQDLVRWQEQFQSLTELHQTALEELRSSNEELHSVNEELQSTNEELETSKEELQSVNEEMHTINLQLSDKVGELDQSNSDLRNLFESTEIATVFLDRHLVIRSFTRAIATLYSLIPSDQGRPLTDISSRLIYPDMRKDVASVLDTLKPLERRITRDDSSAHYIARLLPYRELDNSVSGVLMTFVDVTSIVQAETALREADIRKDVFLATLSHELRNPLAPIRTAARLLETPNLPPVKLARAQAIIARQVHHMGSLLDDLLDVSRITRGSFPLKRVVIDLKSLIEAAVEAVQPAMDAKRHTLRVEIPEIPVLINADPVRLAQVLSNLLTNAAKYTPAGGIICVGSHLDARELAIFVRDNGIGLAADVLPTIFEMFARADTQGVASEGGLGIGLALSRGLVQLHGGRISAQSAGLGKGSEFVVALPRSLIVSAPPASAGNAGEKSDALVRHKVLIVDDNRDAAETLGILLEVAGHEVHLAHTGAEALEVAARVRPDVAVLDIGMPDQSGYDVAKQMRAEPWGEKMILIALTGWGQENDKRHAEASGFDHHCTKPVDSDELQLRFSRNGE